jgi:hypothetical protein
MFMYLAILISCQILYADSCIKEKSHTNSYYYGGVTEPAEDGEREIWIGEKKLCTIRNNWKIVLDIEQNVMFIVNRRDSSYVESSLPFEWSKVVSKELVGTLKIFETKGSVKQTGKKKKIGKWDCQEYEVNSYIMYQGSKVNETDSKIWASTDVLLDVDNFTRLIRIMRKFANYDSSFIDQLGKIEGYQVSLESLFYPKGFSVPSNQKVMEVMEIEPPTGTYEVPAGYSKKEYLSLEELRSL